MHNFLTTYDRGICGSGSALHGEAKVRDLKKEQREVKRKIAEEKQKAKRAKWE